MCLLLAAVSHTLVVVVSLSGDARSGIRFTNTIHNLPAHPSDASDSRAIFSSVCSFLTAAPPTPGQGRLRPKTMRKEKH